MEIRPRFQSLTLILNLQGEKKSTVISGEEKVLTLSFPIVAPAETGWISEHPVTNWCAHGHSPVLFPSQGSCTFLHGPCLRARAAPQQQSVVSVELLAMEKTCQL